MFSTTPTTFCRVWRAMVPARSATSVAASCGVVTSRISDGGQQLRERDGDVAGAGRQVEQQDVEVAPEDVGQELLERPVQHRPAPGDRLVAPGEHAGRDDLHPVGLRRHEHALDLGGAAVFQPEHARHAVAVDVGVEQPDGQARSAASATARLTVTEDLPTPPLPLATPYTRVSDSGRAKGISRSGSVAAQLGAQGGALLVVHHVERRPRRSGRPRPPDRLGDPGGDLARAAGRPRSSGRPRPRPDRRRPMSTDLTMPISVMGRLISGSVTVASAAWTASADGELAMCTSVSAWAYP